VDFLDKPAGFGAEKRDEWTSRDYHQPSDDVKDWWDLTGLVEDGRLLFAVGYRVANAGKYPEWTPGNEFRAAREKSLAAK
jgi:Zn-dependent M28 family amino/carboxypeptidase